MYTFHFEMFTFSIKALSEVLACHDHTQLVALGERYGYAAALPHGYDYITGGGGMVFSKPLVSKTLAPFLFLIRVLLSENWNY